MGMGRAERMNHLVLRSITEMFKVKGVSRKGQKRGRALITQKQISICSTLEKRGFFLLFICLAKSFSKPGMTFPDTILDSLIFNSKSNYSNIVTNKYLRKEAATSQTPSKSQKQTKEPFQTKALKVSPKGLCVFVSFFTQNRVERAQVRRNESQHSQLSRTDSTAIWHEAHSMRSPE